MEKIDFKKMNKETAAMKETEDYVDSVIKETGRPPTYREVAKRFNLKSSCAAYARLRNCRSKMKVNMGNPKTISKKVIYINEGQQFQYGNMNYIAMNGNIQKRGCVKFCGMNYCDDNGCMERTRILVEPILDF